MQSHLNRKALWLTNEKFQSHETVKVGCIPSKNKFITQENVKLKWLASDINPKLLHTGCPITHDKTHCFALGFLARTVQPVG